MKEEGAYSLGSEEIINMFCDPCKHDGHDIEAMGFCVNCHEFLCEMCCKYHKKPLPSRDHTILNKEDMPKKKPFKSSLNVEGKDSTTDNVFDECLKHESEYLKYYCGDHTDFGCTVCMTIGHRACEDVQYIPEVAKTVKESKEFKQFIVMLTRLSEKAHKNVNKAKSNVTELTRSYNETKEQIEEFRIKINDRLDQLQNEIKLQADKLMHECTEKMNQVEKEACEVTEEIALLKVDVDSLVQTRQNVKLFMKTKRSEDEVKTLRAILNQTVNKIQGIVLKFKPDNKLQAIVNDLSSFGSCKQKISHEGDTFTYLRDFSVRSSTDTKRCNIVDLVMLSDDLSVLADDSNGKVKILDMKAGQISLERSISSIRAITKVDENKIAVSYSGFVELLYITRNGIAALKKLDIGNCFSLLFLKTKHYLMAMITYSGEIVVVGLEGTALKTFKPDITIQNACCITNSSDDETVYITDVNKNRLCSYTTEGAQKDVYTTKTLQKPRGIDMSEDGIVYVCGYESNTIHALLPENATMKLVLDSTNGIQHPTCVAVNDVEQQIIIGSKNSDVIKVFEY